MEVKIKEIIARYQLNRQKAIVLAISGGPDSMVLLDLFRRLFDPKKIIVAHANHGLRLEARWDETLVARVAKEYDLRFVSEKLKLASASEAEARQKRYEFLRRVAQESGAKYVLCAHHANDQVETILFSMIRGAGPRGVWGMKEREGDILRPLLGFTRREIIDYAKMHHLKYHLDRTNYDIRYARNRIREKIIPQIERINPAYVRTLGQNAVIGNELSEAIERIVAQKVKRLYRDGNLSIAGIRREPAYIQKEIIRTILVNNLVRPDGLTSANVERVYELLALERGKKTEIGRLVVTRGIKYLTFGARKDVPKQTTQALELGKSLKYGSFVLRLKRDYGRATKNNILLPTSVGYNLKVRAWRDGDRIMAKAGTKKLKDVFADAKISQTEKRTWPVVVSGREVLWVPGLAASGKALSESKKKKVIKIEVRHGKKKQ